MVHALRGGQSEEPEVHVLRGGHSEELRCRLRQKKVVFVGAPFCEGQNLAGTDLAPEAMRRAGVQKAAESLGWAWEDEGDLDFKAHFASRGIAWEKEHLASLERYRAWVASGMEINFSTWDSLNKTPEEKAEEEVKALREALAQKEAILAGKTEEERVAEVRAAEEQAAAAAAAAAGAAGGAHIKPSEVVNSRLIGTGLELVHTAIDKAAQSGAFSLTIGGDHSVAAASISAVQKAYPTLGVIWVDAHADANTPESSPSMHYHGMPAAHLMGWFRQRLEGFDWFPQGQVLQESRLAYIGLRDIDPEEGQMLRESNVHVYTMRDVDKYGIAKVIQMAMQAIDPNQRNPFHLSLDIDAVDPTYAPGTGTCARGGLNYREIHYVCEELAESGRLVGMDLVEVNPGLEPHPPPRGAMHGDNPDLEPTTPTVLLAVELVLSALGKRIMDPLGGLSAMGHVA